jgi:hypothetical protein
MERDAWFGLLRFDVGRPDHLAPCLKFYFDLRREFLRSARDRLVAQRRQAFLHKCDEMDDLAIQQGDDFFWRSGGNEDTDPAVPPISG